MEENSEENRLQEKEPPPSETTLREGWTREEKYALLTALKTYGSLKIKEIAAEIPNKTEEEVRSAIDYYKKKTIQSGVELLPKCNTKRRKIITKSPRIPLAQWAKLLTDKLPYKDLQTETKDAIRLIANFENFPPSKDTEQIDFRKVYHQIADAMEGKSLADDKLITEVLNTCLIDSVLKSKAFIRPKALQQIIDLINLENSDVMSVMSGFNRPTKDGQLATLRHLVTQRNYNPLTIPEEYQAPSAHVSKE